MRSHMAERKIEPVEETVEDAPASPQTQNGHAIPSSTQEAQNSRPASSSKPSENTSRVRNAVLDEIVAHQQQIISKLERQVDKRKETFFRLSSSSPFIPPSGLGVLPPHAPPPTIPPGSAAQASPAVRPSRTQPNPLPATSETVNATQQQQQQRQSQPVTHNPAMTATMAAMAAASTRSMSPALHPQYPFFPFPHPDNPVMAQPFMGIVSPVPPHPTPPPVQTPSTTPSQRNQASEDGGNRQSRYWTADEHQRYLAGVNTFGPKNYQQIAEVVGTRNAKQVRTHSQKYQKKLEREEARRRGDPRTLSDVPSPVQTDSALAVVMRDSTPGQAPIQLRENDAHRGPATVSSKQLTAREAAQSTKSAEGSSSTNNVSSERNAENSIDAVHANAKAAAAAAVAAEAVALGFGRLPAGPGTMLNKHHVASSPNSDLQTQTRQPGETRIAKANGSGIPPTSIGDTTNPGKALQSRDKLTSQAVMRPSPRTNASAARLEAKVTTTMPAGRGAESHQVTKQMFSQKLHDSPEAIAPSRRQSHSSVNVGGVRPRSDKQHVPKVAQSAVKIEPRIVAPSPNSGPLSGFCPALATSTHSRHNVLPASIPSKLETKTVNVKRIINIVEKAAQKPVAGVRNSPLETEVDGNGPVALKKEVSTIAHHKSDVVPNGQKGSQTFPHKPPRVETDVPNKLNADTSLPAGSKNAAQSVSTPSTKADATGQTSDPQETSGNGERLEKPLPMETMKMKTAGQQNQQTPVENDKGACFVQETPRTSDNIHGSAAKGAFSSQKENESGVLPGISKSASIDGAAQKERQGGCVQKSGIDILDGQIKHKSAPKGPVEEAVPTVPTEVPSSRDSFKTGSVMRCDEQHKSTPSSKLAAAPNCEAAVPKTHNQSDQVVGNSEQTTEGDQEKLARDTQVKKQSCNPATSTGEGRSEQEAIKKPLVPISDTGKEIEKVQAGEKEGKTGSSCEIANSHVDRSVDGDGAAQVGAVGGQCEEEKSVEQETKDVMDMDKKEETMETRTERDREDSEKNEKKADMKRALERATESVAKRQKGNDNSGRIDREDKDNWNGVTNREAGKT